MAPTFAQKPAPTPPLDKGKTASTTTVGQDFSKEPIVYDKILTKVVFADDGTYVFDTIAAAKIQAQSAVQSMSVLKFPYASANGTMAVDYVRVRKPDGTLIDTPLDTIQDMPSEISQQAPFYSDLREKQVAVRGLESGDLIEYGYHGQIQKPLAPGEFWYSYNFTKDSIVLDEELQISVPKDRQVTLGSGAASPTTQVIAGQRIYMWSTRHLEQNADDAATQARRALDAPPADVQLTSFKSWNDVGSWYKQLAAPRAVPTPEIRAQAEALTKGLSTDEEKINAIYDYVSLNFRYVGIAFGIGRYQPHAAADVLGNAYGDCKDKETLLASLLAAVGLKAFPALINSTHKIDPSVPSPGQFDHVIAAVPQGDGYLWLDTTTEVAPPGYLLANLRDKDALVISDTGPAQLVKTPPNPPVKTLESFQADGTLSSEGTLQAKMKLSTQGDGEILLRLAFRNTPEAQWPDLLHALSLRMGFGGTVKNVVLSPTNSTNPELQVSYDYTREDYSDWSEKEISPPIPLFFLPDPDVAKKASQPIPLGPPGLLDYVARITLPAGFTPTLPAPIDLVEDFAEYHATYAFASGVLQTERQLIVKEDKIPLSAADKYQAFQKAVEDDATKLMMLEQLGSNAAHQPSPDAATLYAQGLQAWQLHDFDTAEDSFRKATTADPKYGLAWTALGGVDLSMGKADQGLSEMKKALTVDPYQTESYKTLASAQLAKEGPSAALKTWQQLEKIDPNDGDAPARIGYIFILLRQYADALPELEKAVHVNPTMAQLFFSLGMVELKLNHPEEALGYYKQEIALDPAPRTMEIAAMDLADANQYLDLDLGWAQKALDEMEKNASAISLDSPAQSYRPNADNMAVYWGALGWVLFKSGHLMQAERYLTAAWRLSQSPDTADHLGQLYEKLGKTALAAEYYSDALASPRHEIVPLSAVGTGDWQPTVRADNGMPQTRERLVGLLKSDSRADDAVDRARIRLTQLRTTKLPQLTKRSVNSQFFILFGDGGKVLGAKFISGSDSLRNATKALVSAKFDVTFPDDGKEIIVRRGMLDCESELSYCEFTFFPSPGVLAIN
jgi:tetratricopeptide (TPR) repeat protein